MIEKEFSKNGLTYKCNTDVKNLGNNEVATKTVCKVSRGKEFLGDVETELNVKANIRR